MAAVWRRKIRRTQAEKSFNFSIRRVGVESTYERSELVTRDRISPPPQNKKSNASAFDFLFCGIHCTKFEPFLKAIPTRKSETMRTKFCGNNFLGKGFRKTSADSFFLNSDVASGGGGVWGGILRLLLFLFWRNSGGLQN